MQKNIYTVAQINSYIRNMFSEDYLLKNVSVRGEVSNLKYHSSGHIYFSLKDDKALLNCVCFRSSAAGLKFRLENGMSITAKGSVEVYEKDGKFQLYVSSAEKLGAGELAEKFEKLKSELEERGLFAPEYKRPIPAYVKTLGVVTASTGAAIRDIINVSKRRNPFIQIILYPAIVQGEAAADSIVKGIRALEAAGVDVIIIGRGGGSIEDLWAFNEEKVAQAVFDCCTPVISAVGHETDVTISDFVADLRAPTPSAGAERAVADVNAILDKIDKYSGRLNFAESAAIGNARSGLRSFETELSHRMEKKLSDRKHVLANFSIRMDACSPDTLIKKKRESIELSREKLDRLIELKTERERLRLEQFRPALSGAMREKLTAASHKYDICLERIKALSPAERIGKGYGYVRDTEGKAVKSVKSVKKGDKLSIYVSDGQIDTEVLSAKENSI